MKIILEAIPILFPFLNFENLDENKLMNKKMNYFSSNLK
jgi:hypothetical protein